LFVRIWGGPAVFSSNNHGQTTTAGGGGVRVIFLGVTLGSGRLRANNHERGFSREKTT
jgi:hypothetical protein